MAHVPLQFWFASDPHFGIPVQALTDYVYIEFDGCDVTTDEQKRVHRKQHRAAARAEARRELDALDQHMDGLVLMFNSE